MSNIEKKQDNNLSTVSANDFWGDTNLGNEDFGLNFVKLGQKKKEAGLYVFNDGSTKEEILNCKLIVPNKTRVLYNQAGPSRCGSQNFYSPSARYPHPISDNCMTCYAAQWGDKDSKKNSLADAIGEENKYKPLCKEQYSLFIADDNWELFNITFSKTALKIVQAKLFSRLKTFSGIPPFAIAFDMKIKEVPGKGDTYYIPEFDNFREHDQPEKGEEYWRAYSKSAQEAADKHYQKMDEEKVVGGHSDIPFGDDDMGGIPF